MKVYVVGGFVRDYLMGLPSKDKDYVVVGASPQQMIDLGFKKVGADFEVYLHPHTGDEFALARTERKVAAGYLGFETDSSSTITLKQDLSRRDLTINAMAFEVLNWQMGTDEAFQIDTDNLIDYFSGYNDMLSNTLKHVSEAFKEDPVRVLRLLRFAARYNFSIDPSTLQLARDMFKAGELSSLSGERVLLEYRKVFDDQCAHTFFKLLRKLLWPFLQIGRVYPLVHFFYPKDDNIALCNIDSLPMSEYRIPVSLWLLGFTSRQCEVMKVPNEYMWLMKTFENVLLWQSIEYIENDYNHLARTILSIFKGLGVPQHLELFKYSMYCIMMAVPSRQPQPPDNILKLVNSKILDNVYKINSSSVRDNSLTGKALGDAIFDQRVKYLQRMMQDCL